jgi:primosomal protein N' (replication factor Y)
MNISVCLPIALNKSFDYLLPQKFEGKVKLGLRVKVPFGPAEQTGFITALDTHPVLPKNIKLKEVTELADEQVFFGPELFPLAKFIEQTYANTLGETLNVLIPSFINKKLLESYKETPRENLPLFYNKGPLTAAQKEALTTIENNEAVLLHGPALSGKTEAALTYAHKILGAGGQVLILVPDIITSAELIKTVEEKFGQNNIHMWHSKVLLSKRKITAAEILSGKPCIVIGTRSACLLPFKNLRLSIMSMEEDEAFKQEDNKPYYHSREVLLFRSAEIKSKVILISAAPSLEALHLAEQNKIKTVFFKDSLPAFAKEPHVIVTQKTGPSSKFISAELQEALGQNMLNGGQSLLLLNRLGHGDVYACLNCRAFAKCKKCGAVLGRVQDGKEEYLVCKKCGSKESLEQTCPVCKNEIFRTLGGGTQSIVSDLEKMFPSARIFRLDSQTLATKKAEGHQVAQALQEAQADIVVGTHMALNIGLNESKINLAAVLDADGELNSPGFRAAENFTQMLFNLKGRLKKTKNAKLFVQISKSELFDFDIIKNNDYLNFAKNELEFRKEFNFPPYTQVVKILLTAKTKKDLATFSKTVINAINTAYGAYMQVEGPVPCGRQAKDFFQQYLLIKSLDDNMLKSFIKTVAETKPPKQLTVKIIANPYSFI